MSDISTKTAGIDTGKFKLDVALSWRGDCLQINNDEIGYRRLRTWLRRFKVERVGIEASGGYERKVVAYLRNAGFKVAVLQPVQVRGFATFRLKRAKNDKIDAKLIAECTAALEELRDPTDPRLSALSERLTLIEQIEEDIARYKTRKEAFADRHAIEVIDLRLGEMKRLLRTELAAIAAELALHADLANRFDLIQSVQGIGKRTALAILIRMPEIGTLSREETASLAGLAPFDDRSGLRDGQRHIYGGRTRLRRAIYAAALPAAFKWNPALVALYRRLIKAGKKHKCALIACARKLIIYANTVVARGTPWNPTQIPQT